VLESDSLALKGVPVPTCFRYQQQQHPVAFMSHFIQGLAVLYNNLAKPEPITVPNLQFQLIEAMRDYLAARGSELRIVFTYADWKPRESAFLNKHNIPFQHLPTKHKFKDYGQHWTPEGHKYIANKILEKLFLDSVISEDDINKTYTSE
jgi:hypothetical protein